MGTRRTIRRNNSDGSNNDISSLRFANRIIAEGAGDEAFTNLSPAAASFITKGRMQFSEEKIIDDIKEKLLADMFERSHNGMIHGYTLYTIPLSLRHTIKEGYFNDVMQTEAGKVWVASQISTEKKNIDTFRLRIGHLHTLTDFGSKVGSLRYLGVTNPAGKTKNVGFDLDNPEIEKLVRFRDDEFIVPFSTGKPGTGKTNISLQLIDLAVQRNSGYLNPSYGKGESKLRVFMPNYVWPQGSAYAYRHPWEIFIDEPKGKSVLWKRYMITQYADEYGQKPDDVFDMVYLGEVGTGKLKYSNSETTMAYRELFSLSRQFGIRFLLSSADTIALSLMIDFVDPQIVMTANESGTRYAEAQYLNDDATDVIKISLGSVPKHRLIDKIGRGIAADFTGDIEKFRVKKMLDRTHVTDIEKYLKDPDKVIQEASEYVKKWEEDFYNEYGPDYINPDEESVKISREEEKREALPPKKPLNAPDESSGVLF